MKNSGEKVSIGAFREVKKQYLGVGITQLYLNNNRNLNHPTQRYILRDDYDDMIYTLLLDSGSGYS